MKLFEQLVKHLTNSGVFMLVNFNNNFKNEKMIRKMFFLTIVLVAVFSIGVNAQTIKVPGTSDLTKLGLPADKAQFEKDFLAALDPGKDSGIPTDKLTKLLGGNKSYVGDMMGILGGKDNKDTMLSKLTGKNKEWKNMVTGLLGDSGAGKYFTKIDKQLQGFKSKYQIAKMFM